MAESGTEEAQGTEESPWGHRVGCAELPPGMSRARYFEKLSLLEVAAFYTGNPTRKAVRTWREKSPAEARFSLIAHADLLSCSDEERTKKSGHLVDSCQILGAEALVVITPSNFSAGQANRDRLRELFTGALPQEALGSCRRVLVAEGLWEAEAAAEMASELDLLLAVDPLATDPLGDNLAHVARQLSRGEAYVRIQGLGHARRRYDSYALEGLLDQVAELDRSWTLFGHTGKYPDALAFQRLVDELAEG